MMPDGALAMPLAAKPMLGHVLDTARALEARRIVVVYGHGGEVVREALDAPDLAWARQDPPQGTGHAVQQAMPLVEDGDTALILYGDVPLIGVPIANRNRAETEALIGFFVNTQVMN